MEEMTSLGMIHLEILQIYLHDHPYTIDIRPIYRDTKMALAGAPSPGADQDIRKILLDQISPTISTVLVTSNDSGFA